MICLIYCCVTVIQYITVLSLVGHVMCCLYILFLNVHFIYFGSSRERFALLKSQIMIKTESGCFCSVSVIRSARFCKAELTCACGGM